jgi:hypothetical protein
MNERIRELAEQAGILKEQSVQAKIVKNEDGTWTSILEYPDLEKFAELMVRECYVALFPALRDMISRGQAYDMIRQHFGVDK